MLTNSGWKAVAINPSTPLNFPDSMTVSNLTIQGSTNTQNVLLLNYFGTDVPLTVSNGLTLQDDGRIVNFGSGLMVQSGTVLVTNSQIIQDGGLVCMTNARMNLSYAQYQLTNGIFQGGTVVVGYPVNSTFNQFGGAVLITNLILGPGGPGTPYPHGGAYALYGGYLNLPGGLTLSGANDQSVSYLQEGGSNQTTLVYIEPGYAGISPSFILNDGLLADDSVALVGDDFAGANIQQNGGTHIVSNSLAISGGAENANAPIQSTYQLNNGTLFAGNINLNGTPGPASFIQTNGITQAGQLNAAGYWYVAVTSTYLTLSGGTLSCSNLTSSDGGYVTQSGGALIVSNLLTVDGYRVPEGPPPIYTKYTFTGGTLLASNINVGGDWVIGDGTTNRISNPGFISLSHTLSISNATEQLGSFILATNATIDLAGSASQLAFANSSAEAWTTGATLLIADWNGNASGGGAEQLKFGNAQSGLTPAQLNQIQFSIGTNLYPAKILPTGEVVPDEGTSLAGPVNSWINPASGNWDVATNWSLGVLPDSSQSVMITNSGSKAVAINPTTPTTFPASMNIHDLTIRGASDTLNTLLLNFAGTDVPLTVSTGLTVADNAQLVNLSSGLIVESGSLLVTNAHFIQDGGFVCTTNATVYLQTADYDLTNGILEAGAVYLGLPGLARFNQYGGAVMMSNLYFGDSPFGGSGGNYWLYGGYLSLPNGLKVISSGNSVADYAQLGGSNQTTAVDVEDGGAQITLNAGLLADITVNVLGGYYGPASIQQNGGAHVITNALTISGGAHSSTSVTPATYTLNGGTLSASLIELDADQGDSVFTQTNGTANAGTFYAHSVGFYSSHNTTVAIAGGTLSCSNYTTLDGGATLNQSGGDLAVSQLLDFGGVRDLGPGFTTYARYTFTGGSLTASNINISGVWSIGDGSSNRISNPGFFSLSHLLQLSNAVEQLGRFILATNATIDLAGTASRLSFENSSAETWANATLVIADWNGAPSGGGAEQLKFGSDSSGLTPAQLHQIQFQISSSTNFYPAKILSTGEVVPDTGGTPSVTLSRQGTNLVLTWPAGWSLQAATNAPGPYFDLPTASSPYTVDPAAEPQQFFRLRP